MPTSSSYSAVVRELDFPEPETPIIWRHPAGSVRGIHEWLALADLLGCKTGRKASLAANAIRNRLA